jgi:RNA-directed DNA polymerase
VTDGAKPFQIPKQLVWEAFKRVKAANGAGGVDQVSIETYERDLRRNLYRLWNRLSSGSYLAKPVRCVDIAKADGGKRRLGIPTVEDRIAQMVAVLQMEPKVEPQFHADSYGYRAGRSAHQAVEAAKIRCWQNDWLVGLGIKGFFEPMC